MIVGFLRVRIEKRSLCLIALMVSEFVLEISDERLL